MITSKKEKKQNLLYEISHDLISNKITDLVKFLASSVEEIVQAEKKKVKINTSTKFVNQFEAEIKEIQVAYKTHLKKGPLTLESYLNSFNTRAQDLNDMLFKIKTYPIKSITNQLKKEAEEQGIENTKIKTFVNELTNSLVNLVVQYSIQLEEYVIDQLYEKEMNRLGVDYFAENSALKIINPQKHERYTTLLYKGIKAFYYDFKSFVNSESPFFSLIEKFFIKLINKMEFLQEKCKDQVSTENKESTKNESKEFPTHVFKDYASYQLLEQLATHAKNQEEIGFYFRQMSEKETPKLIIAKETSFRTWFNEESEHSIELKNPIKTFDRIKGIPQKYNFYQLVKERVL